MYNDAQDVVVRTLLRGQNVTPAYMPVNGLAPVSRWVSLNCSGVSDAYIKERTDVKRNEGAPLGC